MNREIKFRAWHTVNKRMLGNKEIPALMKNINDSSVWKYMQFTGLTTKKNEEIYEGDIVYVAGKGNVEVKFDCCGYWSFGDCEDYQDVMEDLERVVGHIYDGCGTI